MFFVAIGALTPLIFRCDTLNKKIAIIVYTFCALLMFGISSLYHRVTWTMPQRAAWKKIDHMGIYLMIAGTFTPVALLALNSNSGNKLLLIIWSIAFIGILQSSIFVNFPKLVNAAFYLAMGYIILPYLQELEQTIGGTNLWLIILGGICYSIGAIIYGLKRPILYPKYFSYHEVFHCLVNLGAVFHFIVIQSLV